MIRKVEVLWRHVGPVVFNLVVTHLPLLPLRLAVLRLWGARIGRGVKVLRGTTVFAPERLVIEDHVGVGFRCVLDARGGLRIGHHTVLASDTQLVTGRHDLRTFAGVFEPIEIGDHAWLATRSTVLGGATIGRGAVVAACALVRGDVPPMAIVGGVPAREIGTRESELDYSTDWRSWFH